MSSCQERLLEFQTFSAASACANRTESRQGCSVILQSPRRLHNSLGHPLSPEPFTLTPIPFFFLQRKKYGGCADGSREEREEPARVRSELAFCARVRVSPHLSSTKYGLESDAKQPCSAQVSIAQARYSRRSCFPCALPPCLLRSHQCRERGKSSTYHLGAELTLDDVIQKVLGLQVDLGLSDNQYAIAVAIFSITYILVGKFSPILARRNCLT